jgi:hypothetical protein
LAIRQRETETDNSSFAAIRLTAWYVAQKASDPETPLATRVDAAINGLVAAITE